MTDDYAKARGEPSPWAVICPRHGKIYLEKTQYDWQISLPNATWFCPICSARSEFDDDNYAKHGDKTYTFKISIMGSGVNVREAWEHAVEQFAMDPGDHPAEYTLEDEDSEHKE